MFITMKNVPLITTMKNVPLMMRMKNIPLIPKMKKEFRSFYQNIIDLILARKSEIDTFIRKSLKSNKYIGSKTTR